jgi:hypothetical protein
MITHDAAEPYRRRDGQALRLNASQRSERARNAGRASQNLSAYVRRVVNGAPRLTPEDIAALRTIVMPTDAEIYVAGVAAGVRMAAEHLAQLTPERVA